MVFDRSNLNSLDIADYFVHSRGELDHVSNQFHNFFGGGGVGWGGWFFVCLLVCFRKPGMFILNGKQIVTPPFLDKESFIFW